MRRGALFTVAAGAMAFAPLLLAASPIHSMKQLRATRVRAVVSTSGDPDWIAAGFGSIWLANGTGVLQIDPRTNKVRRVLARGTQPCEGIISGFGSIWTVDCASSMVLRIDPTTGNVVRVALLPFGSPEGEGYITADTHAVWIPVSASTSTSALDRLDPTTNKIVARIKLPYDSSGAAAGFGAIWVTSSSADAIFRIDPTTNAVLDKIHVGPGPRFIAAGANGVWSLNQGDGSVSHVDPTTNTVAATLRTRVPGEGGCITANYGRVWVTMPGTPFSEIDAHSNTILGKWTGIGGDCITTGFGNVWLVNHDLENVWRITRTS